MTNTHRFYAAFLVALVALAAPLMVGADEATEVKAAEIGDVLPDFEGTDYDGNTWKFSKQDVKKADIETFVRKAAAEYGFKADAPWTTQIDSLDGVKEEGEVDDWMRREMIASLGAPFGRLTSEESVKSLKTMGDIVTWIEKLNGKPTVFICWGPRCPTSQRLNEPMHETLAALDARVIALGSNYNDKDEDYDIYIENNDFWARIVPDREQKITAVLGGKKTPHFMVVDTARKLRYRGGLDSACSGVTTDEADKKDWIADAVKAIIAGKDVPEGETKAVG